MTRRALLLISLLLQVVSSLASAETDVPGRRPHGSEGAYVLACRSPEVFEERALEFTRGGFVNSDDCFQINDTKFLVEENRYRVQSSNDGYLCIQTVSQSQCYWTRAESLVHLGRGPQLSDSQFAEAARLHAEASKFARIALNYTWEAEKAAKEAEIAVDPATRQRSLAERDRLYKLSTEYDGRAVDLRNQAASIRPVPRRGVVPAPWRPRRFIPPCLGRTASGCLSQLHGKCESARTHQSPAGRPASRKNPGARGRCEFRELAREGPPTRSREDWSK